MGSIVVGVGSRLADRSQHKVDFGVKFETLLTMEIQSHAPNSCPLCLRGGPYSKAG
jgi:orotate phosphoribosyltransferase